MANLKKRAKIWEGWNTHLPPENPWANARGFFYARSAQGLVPQHSGLLAISEGLIDMLTSLLRRIRKNYLVWKTMREVERILNEARRKPRRTKPKEGSDETGKH